MDTALKSARTTSTTSHSRPLAGDWILYRCYGYQDQKEWSMDFWYSVFSGTPSTSWNAVTAATAFQTAINTPLLNVLSSNAGVIGGEMWYNFGTGVIGTPVYLDNVGTAGSSPIPEDVAVVIQKITQSAGKQNRGRWYVPGIDGANIIGSYLSIAGIGNYQTLAIAFKASVSDQGLVYAPAHFNRVDGILVPLHDDPVVALLGTRRKRRFRF